MCSWLEWAYRRWAGRPTGSRAGAARARAAALLLGWAVGWAVSAPLGAQGRPATETYPGLGRPATPQELAAWDIDVRPDFKGLPRGAGSVAQGMVLWERLCASCHGVFGEANHVFFPIVGGTTAGDVKAGRVAALADRAYPERSSLMKLSTLSTLWDYTSRAMPWDSPKTLKPDEVYALTAYLLNLGGVVPDDFVLSDRTMALAQSRLPNRNGVTTGHALWPGERRPGGALAAARASVPAPRPDVRPGACMKNCGPVPQLSSSLPDHARDAHGNLAEQNRLVGPQRGADTRRAAGAAPAASAAP